MVMSETASVQLDKLAIETCRVEISHGLICPSGLESDDPRHHMLHARVAAECRAHQGYLWLRTARDGPEQSTELVT